MSENCSSSNDSLLHPELSSVNESSSFELDCFLSMPGCLIFVTFTITILLLLLPASFLVLHQGFNQWRQQRSSAPATSHSDSFTYHLITMELLYVFGCVLCCCGIYLSDFLLIMVWYYIFSFTWYGETFFHLMTCVEHYLAVVHPVTYLSLKKERWIRIRNVTIGVIWLLCLGWAGLMALGNNYIFVDVCLLIVSVMVISFCSLSVLWALIHPGPGEQVKVDQSKQRAFYTIVAILAVLLLRCVVNLFFSVQSLLNGLNNDCMAILSELWVGIPGIMVLPLLVIHKAGMLDCGKNL